MSANRPPSLPTCIAVSIGLSSSSKKFFLPLGGKLSAGNRWIKLTASSPRIAPRFDYACQVLQWFGAPEKALRLAVEAPIINACLGLGDHAPAVSIKEKPYFPFLLGLGVYVLRPGQSIDDGL